MRRGEERSYAEAKNQLRHEYAQACIRNKIPAAIGSPPEAINMPNGSMTRHDEIANETQHARTHTRTIMEIPTVNARLRVLLRAILALVLLRGAVRR